ncbi:MAG: hypothetical protein K8R59_11040 [Thermoanaerobaculales bacterium]|nr:hypothetical protein [Thermoanaerobaculales bacterium]
MTRRIQVTGLVSSLVLAIILIGAVPAVAQYGPYSGMYLDERPESGSSEGPSTNPTPTPQPVGHLSLSVTYSSNSSAPRHFPAAMEPAAELVITVTLNASGTLPGQYTLSVLALKEGVGNLSPTRGSLSDSGTWTVHLHAGANAGIYPLLFVAQDTMDNHHSDSTMVRVEILTGDPLLVAGGHRIRPSADSAELRSRHKSWWDQIKMRNLTNPNWFEFLCEDLYKSRAWQQTIAQAVKIDRDRLNITKTMAPIENFKSYTDIQPIMSRYWADTGITVSMVTANRIGDVFAVWRTNTGMVVTTSESVAGTMKLTTPGIKVGNVLNTVGGIMILLDFWSNMSAAESPAESREAWYKAGYASMDLYLATIIGNTFGSTVALPGMWVSYILTNSYDTLIGGHKRCWFKKMVVQALDADLLSEDIHDTLAVNNVKAAMTSSKGLKGTLMDWWAKEAPLWDGKMGGCGSWNLAEARGYRNAFVDRIMRTTEVEIDGKRYHPWSFYYSVSRMLVLDRRREMAREAAEDLRKLEVAYISSLEQTQYRGTFRVVSSVNTQNPIREATVCPTEWDSGFGCDDGWTTGQDGFFTAVIRGHHFSPQGTIRLTIRSKGKSHVFVVPQNTFEKVTP